MVFIGIAIKNSIRARIGGPSCAYLAAAFALGIVFILGAAPRSYAQSGAYTLNGGTASLSGQTFPSATADQSSIYVINGGNLTLTNPTITKTGDSSSTDKSSQYGINAALLANSAGVVTISGGSITANAAGANGLFATGSGSSITMTGGVIHTNGALAHGVDVTYTGVIHITNVDVTTEGASSSAIATDFGGGTVTVTGGTIIAAATSANSHSAGIYSTGNITVSGAAVTSAGDCGGVIDGSNSISLINTSLTGALEGIKAWKTAPSSGSATISIDGGSLTAVSGSAFYISGTTSSVTAKGNSAISAGTGKIVNALSSATASFTAIGETLTGNLTADSTSAITAGLQSNTTLTGAVSRAAMTIDSTSAWNVNAASTVTSLSNSGAIEFESSGLTITDTGAFTQASSGKLSILLGGASSCDQIAVTGAANLNGVLQVDKTQDFTPTVGQTFTLITRGSGSGAFSSLTSNTGLAYTVAYGAASVSITITSVSPTSSAGVCWALY